MPEAELQRELAQVREEVSTLRLKAKRGSLEQPHQVRQMRRQIARMLTLLNEQAARHG